MKLSTKLALAAIASTFSMGAFAACAETSDTYTAGPNGIVGEYEAADDTTCFMQTDFKAPISANVTLKWVQNETAMAVASSSSKGRNNYSGSSEGGRVAQCGEPTTGSTAPTTADPDMSKENGCGR